MNVQKIIKIIISKAIKVKIKDLMPVVILLALSLTIAIKNYDPGTFLSGWDTLHPEFNFSLNLQRMIFGVFRTEQGLGAAAAHSQMSELPRLAILYIFHIFFPINSLRYIYVFANLVFGSLGMYFLLYKVIIKNKTISLVTSLLYLLNIGTMQQFIVPFEMFSTQYCFLPWIFLFAHTYISEKNRARKTLLIFAILSFLSAPMAYAATLWYLFFIIFVIYFFTFSVLSSKSPKIPILKRLSSLIIVIFLINCFWILPNLYFVTNHGKEVTQANINKLFSQQAFLYNKEFGNIKDVVSLKTFYFDWQIYSYKNNKFTQITSSWQSHLNNPAAQFFIYSIGLAALAGLLYGLFNKDPIAISFTIPLLICLLFLINDNSPTSALFTILQEKIPLFQEAFRFPDDKVSTLFIFIFCVYFAYGQSLIKKILMRLKENNFLIWRLNIVMFTIILLYISIPAFTGNFINSSVRTKIPQPYFQMFSWFNQQQDSGRIALLPINSFWGWAYYNWGYQGAGFTWFGIKQPLLDRDFDRWSPFNEQYYREMSYAVYKQDTSLLNQVLQKYSIHYILLDTSIIAPGDDPKTLFYPQIKKMLRNDNSIFLAKTFGENLYVYKIRNDLVQNSHVFPYLLTNYKNIQPKAKSFYEDFAYEKYGQYITKKIGAQESIYFPFRNIIDNQNRLSSKVVSLHENGIDLKPLLIDSVSLDPQTYVNQEEEIMANFFVGKDNSGEIVFALYPILPITGSLSKSLPITVRASLPQENQTYIVSVNQRYNFSLKILNDNSEVLLGTVILNTQKDNVLNIYSQNPDKTFLPDLQTGDYSLTPCEGRTNSATEFGITPLPDSNGFSIYSKNSPICFMYPLSNIDTEAFTDSKSDDKDSNKQILLGLSYRQSGTSNSDLCLAQVTNGSCVYYLNEQFGSQNDNLNLLQKYFGIDKNDWSKYEIKTSFNPEKLVNGGRVYYANLAFTLTNPIETAVFSRDTIISSLSNTPRYLTNKATVNIPFSGNEQLSHDITLSPRFIEDCPSSPLSGLSLNSVKKEILKQQNNNYIRYVSYGGSYCDHFSYQNLSQKSAYILIIKSRNISGLPMRLCVTNYYSRRCDLYTDLSSSKNFDDNIFLLPTISSQNYYGYDVNIDNFAVPGMTSTNDIKSIEIVPVPYQWLSQISSSDSNAQRSHAETISAAIEHPNQSLYIIPSFYTKKRNTVLVLPQSFENNWKAYAVDNTGLLTNIFPFLFGTELKQHVLVNNWENGWEINKPTASGQGLKTKDKRPTTIVIVFLPQYLEYIGFVLLILTFSWLCAPSLLLKKEKVNNNQIL